MSDLFAARSQMAVSLAFHIVFAAIGIGLPAMMAISEAMWLRRGDAVWLQITRAWAKGAAIFFAVGAVSGTVLSFELGLLWPRFMEFAGPIVGFPFSLEGFAFFTEAIFLGIYLYGWDRVPRIAHWLSGVAVAVSGAMSAVFVMAVNGWMNAPTGFALGPDGTVASIDPVVAMNNDFWIPNTIHMLIAAYMATGFGAAAIHAWQLRRDPANLFHRKALRLALVVGGVMAVLQPLSGDFLARRLHTLQPAKLAAMEGQWETTRCAGLRLGGIPDPVAETTRFALEIPCGLSLLVGHDPQTEIRGLKEFPRDERPDPRPVHFAFQIMVGIGTLLAALAAWAVWIAWRRGGRFHEQRRYLWLLVPAGPLGFVAIEAGWVVTEVGRQPWVIQDIMKTADAVTPMPGLIVPFLGFTLLYLLLSVLVVLLLRRQVRHAPSIPAPESRAEALP